MTISNRVFSRVPGVVLLLALTASVASLPAKPAKAEDNHIQRYGEEDKEDTPAQKAAKKEADKAYQRSLGNIPAQQTTDPWGIARGNESQPKAVKTAPPKPKAKTDAASTSGTAAKQ